MSANKIKTTQTLIVLSPALLVQMGRSIPLPFQIKATVDNSNQTLSIKGTEILRLLPQRRLVCKADYQGSVVIVKLFFHPSKAEQDYQNELQGYKRLIKSTVLTPAMLSNGAFSGEDSNQKGYFVSYEIIHNNVSLENLISTRPDSQSKDYIKELLEIVANMHNVRIQQIDLHLNNFLHDKEHNKIYTIDSGDVSDLSKDDNILSKQLHKNLADILSQLPIIYDQFIDEWVQVYQQSLQLDKSISNKKILRIMQQWRQWRIRKYLKKASRNCTDFRYKKNWTQLQVCHRDYSSGPWLSFYKQLDKRVESSPRLKDGNTATVALAECATQKVVIKRYNIKNLRHRLSRFWRPSRAWKTWQNAHQLHVLGIKTPEPIAVIEQRFGWFRGKAFYLSEYEPAQDALSKLSQLESLNKTILEDFEQLFTAMKYARLSHGDLKANNILLTRNGLSLIDLDAMSFHSNHQSFKKAFNRDLKRFMKNWKKDTKVYQQFEMLVSGLYAK